MLLLGFTSSARSFGLKKTTYLLGMQWECCWKCKVSTGFARLNIGVAFATIFRNSSLSGVSPKKSDYNTDSYDSVDDRKSAKGKFLSGGLGIFATVF